MGEKSQYAILRFTKHKAGPAGALEAHHERWKEQYASNPDIDVRRSKDNFHIIQPTQKYRREINSRIKAAGCRTRKDSTMFVDTLITASPEFFQGRSRQEVRAYFTEAVAFMEQKVGRGNIFSAVVHMDEKTPHLHLCFTPITKDGRLSAKEILGNRVQLSRWQDEFHAHMNKAFPVLQRGESSLVTKRKHIPTWLFKQSTDLSKQQQAIEQVISQIGVLNAGKKRDELLQMVEPYFSQLEKHLGQMKKYQSVHHPVSDPGEHQSPKPDQEGQQQPEGVGVVHAEKGKSTAAAVRGQHSPRSAKRTAGTTESQPSVQGTRAMKHFQNYGGTFGKKEETDQPHQHPSVSGRGHCQVPSAGYPGLL